MSQLIFDGPHPGNELYRYQIKKVLELRHGDGSLDTNPSCTKATMAGHIVHIDGAPEPSAPSGRCSETEVHWARERRKRQRCEATIAKLTEQA